MKTLTVIESAPNFIKAAAVRRAVTEHNRTHSETVQDVVVYAGAHDDSGMSDVFVRELGITPPDHVLSIDPSSDTPAEAQLVEGFRGVLTREQPDVVLVYGEGVSALAATSVASAENVALGHLEAGLRCFNPDLPEETRRVRIDSLSSLLFCSTRTAVDNLHREGITQGVHLTGDVMYDSTLHNTRIALAGSHVLRTLGLISYNAQLTPFSLATVHRPDNTEVPQRLAGIFEGFHRVASPENLLVVPLHPRTRLALVRHHLWPTSPHILLTDPISYFDMLVLLKHAHTLITDSTGMQKEAYFFRVPCITLRQETEWTETVTTGTNQLVGTDPDRIQHAFHNAPTSANWDPALYGDGYAGGKIVGLLVEFNARNPSK